MSDLARQVKNSLDEARLLILVVQVLLGFQMRAPFEDRFSSLSPPLSAAHVVALGLLLAAFILFVAPAPCLELAYGGETSTRLQSFTTVVLTFGLLPFVIALSLNAWIVVTLALSETAAAAIAGLFFAVAIGCWYLFAWVRREHPTGKRTMTHRTALSDRLQQVMTESRMIVPGAQALLGFQFSTVFTTAFDRLSTTCKIAHIAGMCCIALATVLLIAPASFHRIAENGEDSERVVRVGAVFVLAALLPLAAGVALDVGVVVAQTQLGSSLVLMIPAATFLVAMIVWFVFPLAVRHARVRRDARM